MTDAPVQRARALADLGRHAEARDVVRGHLATTPDDAQALCLFAECCLRLGDRAALDAAVRAVPLAPDDIAPLCLAAFAAAVQGTKTRASRRFAEAAVALDPMSFDAHYTRAQIEVFAIRPSKAGIASARTAVQLAPDDSAARRVLGELLKRTGKITEARPLLREALRLDPNDPSAHAAAGSGQLVGQRLGKAAEHFATSAALAPTDVRARHNLGVVIGRFVRIVHLLLVLGCIWFLDPGRGSTSIRVAALCEAVVVLVVTALVVRRARSAMHGRAGRFFRAALRRDRLLAAWILMLAVGLVCVVVIAAVPGSQAVPWRVGYVVAVAGVASMLRLLRFLAGRSNERSIV